MEKNYGEGMRKVAGVAIDKKQVEVRPPRVPKEKEDYDRLIEILAAEEIAPKLFFARFSG